MTTYAITQYSKIGIRSHNTVVDLNELIKGLIRSMAIPDEVKINIEQPLPVAIFDQRVITDVFGNLLSNAWRALKAGSGQITINGIEQEQWWQFSVSDNGCGIAAEHQEQVFDMFYSIPQPDKIEGLGIGLAIVKKSVNTCGGQVWLQSDLNKGSTFYFTMPKEEAICTIDSSGKIK